jgi:hypothetical protein
VLVSYQSLGKGDVEGSFMLKRQLTGRLITGFPGYPDLAPGEHEILVYFEGKTSGGSFKPSSNLLQLRIRVSR